jgi:hypothetical protein
VRLGLSAVLLAGVSTHAAGATVARVPVVLELFTSEGCSSCPPAEALLEKLDREQPVAGVNAIVLSEHVDYWDNLGWADPYSSSSFTLRQNRYGQIFHLDSVYTPQLVVDGATQLVGGDVKGMLAAIAKSGRNQKVLVRIESLSDGHIQADVERLPTGPSKAGVFLAIADDSATSKVLRGENASRTLHHVAVVRSIREVGNVTRSAAFSKQIELGKLTPNDQRVILFVQDASTGRVLGAAMLHTR